MFLLELPRELLLYILEVAGFGNKDLLNLALTCRRWGSLALPNLWRVRRLFKGVEYNQFKTTIQRSTTAKALHPYGEYVRILQLNELDNDPAICIDSAMIRFLAESCPNLHELTLRFSSKPHPRKIWKLPLTLLADRLKDLYTVFYEHPNVQPAATGLRQLMNQWLDEEVCDDNEDAFCKIAQENKLRNIMLYYPKIPNPLWETLASSAGTSLEGIRITINGSLCADLNPSLIARSFAKHCTNLRSFDMAAFNCTPVSKLALEELIQAASKLTHLDLPVASDAACALPLSTSLNRVYLSSTINGEDLKHFQRMDSLKNLSILKIDGICDFKFLNMLPNLEYLQIGEYGEFNDEAVCNIVNNSRIKHIELVKTPTITDKGLGMLGSMETLVKFNICDRLQNVTREGWLALVKRPIGCPSWDRLSIDDGRKIDPEFFEILHNKHPRLRKLSIRGINRHLYDDAAFSKLKFYDAWQACQSTAAIPVLQWPHRKKKPSKHVPLFDM
ncbi:hypothetical protein G9A89_006896 [Geosiphon pyriformis]|nr:hypothetical protein G9A89_006896 [Geosiphon pyriformis]